MIGGELGGGGGVGAGHQRREAVVKEEQDGAGHNRMCQHMQLW
jgi:hypothetical protein